MLIKGDADQKAACPVAAAQVGVSLVLSFMVVWDLPAIAAGVGSLRTSRLAPFYNEVAPSLAVFGQLFGKALQAQARSLPPGCHYWRSHMRRCLGQCPEPKMLHM